LTKGTLFRKHGKPETDEKRSDKTHQNDSSDYHNTYGKQQTFG